MAFPDSSIDYRHISRRYAEALQSVRDDPRCQRAKRAHQRSQHRRR